MWLVMLAISAAILRKSLMAGALDHKYAVT